MIKELLEWRDGINDLKKTKLSNGYCKDIVEQLQFWVDAIVEGLKGIPVLSRDSSFKYAAQLMVPWHCWVYFSTKPLSKERPLLKLVPEVE